MNELPIRVATYTITENEFIYDSYKAIFSQYI